MGDHIDFPIGMCDEKEMQQRRLKKKSQYVNQLDEVIEEIRKLMLESTQQVANNGGRIHRGGHAKASGQQQQQQHHGRGVDGQIHVKVWDPKGSQTHQQGSHEQELVIFVSMRV
jgi:hypothetical protein